MTRARAHHGVARLMPLLASVAQAAIERGVRCGGGSLAKGLRIMDQGGRAGTARALPKKGGSSRFHRTVRRRSLCARRALAVKRGGVGAVKHGRVGAVKHGRVGAVKHGRGSCEALG
eukprot:556263-Prymnesium_polylepis.1